jgi:hypothetical protein
MDRNELDGLRHTPTLWTGEHLVPCTQYHRLLDYVDSLRAKNAKLHADNTQAWAIVEGLQYDADVLQETYTETLREPCPDADREEHCTCVPLLRAMAQRREAEIEKLKAALEAAPAIDVAMVEAGFDPTREQYLELAAKLEIAVEALESANDIAGDHMVEAAEGAELCSELGDIYRITEDALRPEKIRRSDGNQS